ncbi:CPBP family intramembrane glutamic endopeptidase [Lactobacillus sp. B4005]|uniref:CPBP family intramembrane glutamic endopeptidase n=1 Tax=Lactobacillus sp. B4005 TaxID=2818031 RepID=UPI002269A43D|nr:CPBP family intramembrane glutamic endopeptidase [Lactobacillus sp. B4005]MCX8722911.1 CPBP family intramembrane metalloprotease [Lactobacillus sp. B4005]
MKQLGKITLSLLKAIGFLIWFLFSFIFMEAPTLAYIICDNETRNNVNIWHHVLVLIIGCLVGFVSVYPLYKKVNGTPIWSIKLSIKNLLISFGFTILSTLIESIIGNVLKLGSSNDNDLIRLLHTQLGAIVFFTLVISGPIFESMLFQGSLQGGIFKKLNLWLAILLTSLLFAFAHGYELSWSTFQLFISGLSFSLIYLITKDIKMVIFSHGLLNLIIWIFRFF